MKFVGQFVFENIGDWQQFFDAATYSEAEEMAEIIRKTVGAVRVRTIRELPMKSAKDNQGAWEQLA